MPLVVAILLCLAFPLEALAGVQARVEPNPTYLGDPVRLYLEVSGADRVPAPDTAPLKKDFEILGSTESTRIAVTNGRRSETHGWILSLKPKRAGHLRIPALTLGQARTAPLELEVRPLPPALKRRLQGQVAIETELIPPDAHPYVQQQVLLRVRLYHTDQVLDGRLADPAPNGDVVLERIGDDRRYRVTRNGRYLNVIERLYVLFPQRSGHLEIPPLRFEGHLRAERDRGDPLMQRLFGRDPFTDPFFRSPFGGALGMDPFARPGRAVSAASKPRTLEVRPRPAAFKGRHWLPSAALTLKDSWAEHPPRLQQGEPVSRTLTLEAKGLEASQLPILKLGPIPGVEVFPEPPENDDRVEGDQVVGRSRQRFTLVPQRPGTLELPGIRLDWWDTGKDRPATAVLPRWRLKVAAAPKAAPPPPQVRPAPSQSAASAPGGSYHLDRRSTAWAAGAVLLLGLVYIWWRVRRRAGRNAAPKVRPRVEKRPRPDSRPLWKALARVCREGDAAAAERILLDLARLHWPEDPPLDLAALGARLETRAADQVRALIQVRYAPAGGTWQGEALCRVLDGRFPLREAAGPRQAAEPLPPLYPPRPGR